MLERKYFIIPQDTLLLHNIRTVNKFEAYKYWRDLKLFYNRIMQFCQLIAISDQFCQLIIISDL